MKLIKKDLNQAWEQVWSQPVIKMRPEVRKQVSTETWFRVKIEISRKVSNQIRLLYAFN